MKVGNRSTRSLGVLLASAAMLFGLITQVSPVAAATNVCTGEVRSNINTAKASFKDRCGRAWNDQVRDQCTWVNNPSGWLCHQHAPNGVKAPSSKSSSSSSSSASKPTKPTFVSIGDVGRFVSVIWRSDSSLKGVNVYRNGRYVTSVNMPNNVFNDYSGKMGDRYYLVGYDKNNKFSDRSPEQRPVGVPTSVTSVRWHTNVVHVKWNKPNGAKSFEVYKNNRLIARTSNTVFVDKDARGNSSYTIKVIDRFGQRGPASQKARQPSRITARNGQAITTGETQAFTQQLTGNREFRGTMTVDANTGISMEGSVYDNAGNNLGSVSQSHNGSLVETWARPKYDPNGSHYVLRMDADPMELAPGSTLEKLASFFRSKPASSGGGGGGGGGGNEGRQPSGAPGVEFDDNGYPQGDHAGP